MAKVEEVKNHSCPKWTFKAKCYNCGKKYTDAVTGCDEVKAQDFADDRKELHFCDSCDEEIYGSLRES